MKFSLKCISKQPGEFSDRRSGNSGSRLYRRESLRLYQTKNFRVEVIDEKDKETIQTFTRDEKVRCRMRTVERFAAAVLLILLAACTGRSPEKVARTVYDKDPEKVAALYRAVYADDRAGVEKLIQERTAVDELLEDTDGIAWYDATYENLTPLIITVRLDHYEIAEDLIGAGADCNKAGAGDITPLMMAAGTGNVRMTKLLLAHGADTAARDEAGSQAIGDAAEKGYTEIVKLLIEKGADVNAAQTDGLTPLMAAVNKGKVETVKELLAAGADVKATTTYGMTALTVAVQNKEIDLAKILIAAGADTSTEVITDSHQSLTLLCQAASLDSTDMIKLLVQHGADVNRQSADGFFPLLAAAQSGEYKAAVTLTELGADVNEANERGETALIFASGKGNNDIVEYLINHGSKIDSTTKIGDTALWGAILEKGTLRTVKILLQAGADPNATTEVNGETYTPLAYAREQEDADLASLLKRYGAK